MSSQTEYVATDRNNQRIGTATQSGEEIEVAFDWLICLSELRLSPVTPRDPLLAESLTCDECGNDGPDTLAEAIAEGWRSIEHQPEGVSWNFIGTCPCCVLEA